MGVTKEPIVSQKIFHIRLFRLINVQRWLSVKIRV